jgi:hypothetical protein
LQKLADKLNSDAPPVHQLYTPISLGVSTYFLRFIGNEVIEWESGEVSEKKIDMALMIEKNLKLSIKR